MSMDVPNVFSSLTKKEILFEIQFDLFISIGGSDDAKPVDASRLDMRVGKIVNVERHPDADTLYIEKGIPTSLI